MIRTNSTKKLYKRTGFEKLQGLKFINEIKELPTFTKGSKFSKGEIESWAKKLSSYGKLGKTLEEVELVLPVNAEYRLEDLLVNDPRYLILIETYCNALYDFILERREYVESIMLMPNILPKINKKSSNLLVEPMEEPPKYKLDATIKYLDKMDKYFHKLRDKYKKQVNKVTEIKSTSDILNEENTNRGVF